MNEPNETPTPRTDALQNAFNENDDADVILSYCEMADFARTLERELAEAKAEHERAMNRKFESFNLMEQQLTEEKARADKAEKVVRQLIESLDELTTSIEASHIDWSLVSSASPDYNPDYRPSFPQESIKARQLLALARKELEK